MYYNRKGEAISSEEWAKLFEDKEKIDELQDKIREQGEEILDMLVTIDNLEK